jgi:hypothetical protein
MYYNNVCRQILVGFGRGQLHQVDLRNSKPDKGYKGCVGAVTDIATATLERDRLIVSTSLDRQIRVHKYDSKEILYRVSGFIFMYNVFGTYPSKPKPTHVKRCI